MSNVTIVSSFDIKKFEKIPNPWLYRYDQLIAELEGLCEYGKTITMDEEAKLEKWSDDTMERLQNCKRMEIEMSSWLGCERGQLIDYLESSVKKEYIDNLDK